jgi:hypothetical protein
MRLLFRLKGATGTGMGRAIAAGAATTTVGTAAATMAGAIIAIGGDFHVKPKKREAAVVGGLFFAQSPQSRTSALSPIAD